MIGLGLLSFNILPSFNITNMILAIIGPIIANYLTTSPYSIKEFLMFLMIMYIYTVILILYKCRNTKKTIKQKVTVSIFPVIPWIIWAIALIVMSYMINPMFMIVSGLMRSILGLILVSLIFYLPSLKISTGCF